MGQEMPLRQHGELVRLVPRAVLMAVREEPPSALKAAALDLGGGCLGVFIVPAKKSIQRPTIIPGCGGPNDG